MNAVAAWFTPERLSVLSRVVAASLGAYVIVNLATMALNFLLPALLPVDAYKALLFAMQISFLFYTLLIIWAFAARTARKVWTGMLGLGVPLLLIDLYFYATELAA